MEDREWLKTTAPEAAAARGRRGRRREPVSRDYKVEVSGKLFDVKVIGEAAAGGVAAAPAAGGSKPPKRERKGGGAAGASSESLPSPLQGTVLKVAVEQGAEVAEGDLICVIEAMKMENEIAAHRSGKVDRAERRRGRRGLERRRARRDRVGGACQRPASAGSGARLACLPVAASLPLPVRVRAVPSRSFALFAASSALASCCAFLAGQRDFGAASRQSRPTQSSRRRSSRWRKLRIGKKFGDA